MRNSIGMKFISDEVILKIPINNWNHTNNTDCNGDINIFLR